ncbi:transmembrane protein, putative [Medicago truncatula]|uniref:Transmembrane protein, putative n=1 Tax=Medicago truncatula TaxID=3880 RepID=A0A072V9K2_MEDTR|nr:transmembrane protein, putative [Medicago truncatula]
MVAALFLTNSAFAAFSGVLRSCFSVVVFLLLCIFVFLLLCVGVFSFYLCKQGINEDVEKDDIDEEF